jgi:hypothetical protein
VRGDALPAELRRREQRLATIAAANARLDARHAEQDRQKAIVELVVGWINAVLGFRRFSLRGEATGRGEWNVVRLAVNVKRVHRIQLA